MFLSDIFNRFKKVRDASSSSFSSNCVSDETHDVDADIYFEDFYFVVDIKEDCDLISLMHSTKSDVDMSVLNKIANGILLDGNLNIKKKKIYIFDYENAVYNICFKGDVVSIDEKTFFDSGEVHIDEKSIELNRSDRTCHISRMKHDSLLSTFYVKFFPCEELYSAFELPKVEAMCVARELLRNLSKISGTQNILDLSWVHNFINFIGGNLDCGDGVSFNDIDDDDKTMKI